MQYVIKRNNDVIPFDGGKIYSAITKASKECGRYLAEEQMNDIIISISKFSEGNLTVEEIQDEVVDRLMKVDTIIAKTYQGYRAVRHEKRKQGEQILREIDGMVEKTSEKLSENANKDGRTISVQRDILAGISSKEYYLNYILPKRIANAHKNFDIHVHDLDYLLFRETNCELVNLEKMLRGGCKIGNACMDEPKSIEVAVGHTVQIVASVSSNTFGGCTIPYLDRTLVPYVRKTFVKNWNVGLKWLTTDEECEKDEDLEEGFKPNNDIYFQEDWTEIYKTLKEKHKKAYKYAKALTLEAVRQSMQGLEYEINSLSTVNGQTPFTTIGIGTETSWEGKVIQKAIFSNRASGFGKNKDKTAIFPKIAYAACIGHNLKPEDKNWDVTQLAFHCMGKAIYPDILFVTLEQIANGTVVYPMGEYYCPTILNVA
ncbi:MAG: anaerobic ribonucleoside-triphosphate reductase [Cetobacterium sp.]|uniref:anaerobic ribonucleoside-triphosphate reductase n=1 Tax=Cetobacterium sp. TaxID=2071632 RepID=UPI003F415ACE